MADRGDIGGVVVSRKEFYPDRTTADHQSGARRREIMKNKQKRRDSFGVVFLSLQRRIFRVVKTAIWSAILSRFVLITNYVQRTYSELSFTL